MSALGQSRYDQQGVIVRAAADLREWNYQTNPSRFAFRDESIDYEDIAQVVLTAFDDWLHGQMTKSPLC